MTIDTGSFFVGLATALLPLLLAVAVSYGRFKQSMQSIIERLSSIEGHLSVHGPDLAKLAEWRHGVKNWQQLVNDRLDRLENPHFRD